jgi:GNAT superfamily N-acetyltransferase
MAWTTRPRPTTLLRVPIVEDAAAGPTGRLLLDQRGRLLARFQDEPEGDRRRADLFELADGVTADQAVPAVLADLAGVLVSGDEALGLALVAAGATVRRHAHLYSWDLRAEPPPAWEPAHAPPGVRVTGLDQPAADLVGAWRAAFPPGHPDHLGGPPPEDVEREIADELAGRVLGPLLPCSGLAVAGDGRVVAAVIVTDRAGPPPYGGPWVCDLFRHPAREWAGLGRLLLVRALSLAADQGLPALSLAVTDGNPARRLYQALGFRHVSTSRNVLVQPPVRSR